MVFRLHRAGIMVPQLSFRTSLLDALTLTEEDGAIVALDWGWARDQAETPLLHEARRQLEAYLDGELTAFDLKLAPRGTPYRRAVWDALIAIPYGAVRTYQQIARVAGGSARSVGQANGSNPIPILIPCHRVLATGGLGGYSGGDGLETKRRLLHLERQRADAHPGPGHTEHRSLWDWTLDTPTPAAGGR